MASNIALPMLLSLVFVAIGVGIILYARTTSAKAQRTLAWPSVDGEIAHSAVLFENERSTDANAPRTYKADVVYRYKVDGRNYSSTTISVCDMSSTFRNAENIVERYPDKMKVEVYYDPSDPADCVLEPGDAPGVKFLYLIGGAFAVAGVFFAIMSLTGHVNVQSTHARF